MTALSRPNRPEDGGDVPALLGSDRSRSSRDSHANCRLKGLQKIERKNSAAEDEIEPKRFKGEVSKEGDPGGAQRSSGRLSEEDVVTEAAGDETGTDLEATRRSTRNEEPPVPPRGQETAVRLDFILDKRGNFAIRDKLMTIFEIAKAIDPVVELGTFDKKITWSQPGDLPEKMVLWDLLHPLEFNTKAGKTIRYFLQMKTSMRIEDIKMRQRMKQYLWPNKIFLNVEHFSARPVVTVGWLKNLFHKAVRFDDVKGELIRWMKAVDAEPRTKLDGEMILTRGDEVTGSGGGNLIPQFTLYVSQRTYKCQGHKVSAIVVNVRAAREDQTWLSYLLSEAISGNKERDIEFVEQGIEDEQYFRELGHHRAYVDECVMIPLIGVHRDTLRYELLCGETFHEVLKRKTEARSLEPTNRSDDIGKYFLVVEKKKAREARRYIDHELQDVYLTTPLNMRIPGFPYPRRASQPLRRAGRPERSRAEDETPLEELASQTKMNTNVTKGVILVDAEDYPPLAKARKTTQWSTPKEAVRNTWVSEGKEKTLDIEKDLTELQCQIADEKLAATRMAKQHQKDVQEMESRISSQLKDMREESERRLLSQREAFERQITLCQTQFTQQIERQARESEERTEAQIRSLREDMANLNSSIVQDREAQNRLHKVRHEETKYAIHEGVKNAMAETNKSVTAMMELILDMKYLKEKEEETQGREMRRPSRQNEMVLNETEAGMRTKVSRSGFDESPHRARLLTPDQTQQSTGIISADGTGDTEMPLATESVMTYTTDLPNMMEQTCERVPRLEGGTKSRHIVVTPHETNTNRQDLRVEANNSNNMHINKTNIHTNNLFQALSHEAGQTHE